MSNQITSQVVGALMQDARFPDWWRSEAVPIPFFSSQQLPVTFMGLEADADTTFIAEADETLTSFFALNESYRDSIAPLVYQNCKDYLEDIGFDEADKAMWAIKNPTEIWQFVHPGSVYVSRRPYQQPDMYVQVSCECDWEPEHGLQLVFRQGKKLTRVSGHDGHLTEADAYDKPDEEDELLSAF